MANNFTLSSLDFPAIKEDFKSFLRSQTVFKDYDFEDSNMSVLLDILAYNAYHHGFYTNMVFAEQFLDSAQLRDSVVSHSKELNYLPKSRYSSTASIILNLTTNINSLTIPKGLHFTGKQGTRFFKFCTDRASFHTSSTGNYAIPLRVYEGAYFQDVYIFDTHSDSQRFIITNPNVDINSIVVRVSENNGQLVTTYTKAENLYNVSDSSTVYFIQGAEQDKYEIVFGNNIFGLKPNHSSTIILEYRVSDGGPDADGVSAFTVDEDVAALNSGLLTASSVTTVAASSGGANHESLATIKFNAPRHFAAQERGVATVDYRSLILNQFSGIIEDVNVYGGESLEPKQYGRVVITTKPFGGTITTDTVKAQIVNYLKNLISIPVRLITNDPEYFYIGITTTIQADILNTTLLAEDIESLVSNTIFTYSDDNLGMFDKDFRYSKLSTLIDGTNDAIVSNELEALLIKRLTPPINTSTNYTVTFGAALNKISSEIPVITSSAFNYINQANENAIVTNCFIKDVAGRLIVYSISRGETTTINTNIGSVDYTTGRITISSFAVSSYGSYISLYADMADRDIVVNKNQILLIDPTDVNITVEEAQS